VAAAAAAAWTELGSGEENMGSEVGVLWLLSSVLLLLSLLLLVLLSVRGVSSPPAVPARGRLAVECVLAGLRNSAIVLVGKLNCARPTMRRKRS